MAQQYGYAGGGDPRAEALRRRQKQRQPQQQYGTGFVPQMPQQAGMTREQILQRDMQAGNQQMAAQQMEQPWQQDMMGQFNQARANEMQQTGGNRMSYEDELALMQKDWATAHGQAGQPQNLQQYGTGFVPPDRPPGGEGVPEGGYGTGFVPQQQRQVQYQGQANPNFSHQQLAGNYQQGIGNSVDTRHDVRMFQGQPVGGGQPQQRAYGQQQGFGQGYMAPRRSLGDQHRTAPQRVAASAGRGYNPRTSAQLYGGRPRGQARPPQMNQMQAMTRPAVGAGTYAQRPYGGSNAVTRRRW